MQKETTSFLWYGGPCSSKIVLTVKNLRFPQTRNPGVVGAGNVRERGEEGNRGK